MRSSSYDIVVPLNLKFCRLSNINFLTANILSSSLMFPNLYSNLFFSLRNVFNMSSNCFKLLAPSLGIGCCQRRKCSIVWCCPLIISPHDCTPRFESLLSLHLLHCCQWFICCCFMQDMTERRVNCSEFCGRTSNCECTDVIHVEALRRALLLPHLTKSACTGVDLTWSARTRPLGWDHWFCTAWMTSLTHSANAVSVLFRVSILPFTMSSSLFVLVGSRLTVLASFVATVRPNLLWGASLHAILVLLKLLLLPLASRGAWAVQAVASITDAPQVCEIQLSGTRWGVWTKLSHTYTHGHTKTHTNTDRHTQTYTRVGGSLMVRRDSNQNKQKKSEQKS